MILVTGWRIKRLENLILAASSDVPAKAELSFCQLLTEYLIVIWPFPIFSSISFGSEWWENLLNKSLNSSIGILTISCRRTLRFGRMKIKIFTSIILTFLQIHTDAFIRWSVHLNLDPNNAMNLSQPEYYIAVKSVDINFLFAKVKMFTRDIEIVFLFIFFSMLFDRNLSSRDTRLLRTLWVPSVRPSSEIYICQFWATGKH